jgi:sulfoxide reductase heme-binding subunit YedZ
MFTGLSIYTNALAHGETARGPLEFSFSLTGRSFTSQLTVATGYIATVLLALTLLVGPLNLLLRRRNPLSSYLRRDLGTWVVIFSVAHVVLALRSDYHGVWTFVSFFVADGRPLTDDFGLGNWTGLAALVIAVGLLAISTTRSIRELRPERWKSLQRLNYTLFVLVVLHAIFFGAVREASPFNGVLLLSVTVSAVGQGLGIWLWRRRSARRAPDAEPALG